MPGEPPGASPTARPFKFSYAVPSCAMRCYAMLCCAMLCYGWICYDMVWFANAALRYAKLS
eukprot:834878-Pyramimonas_sp.AAC.1